MGWVHSVQSHSCCCNKSSSLHVHSITTVMNMCHTQFSGSHAASLRLELTLRRRLLCPQDVGEFLPSKRRLSLIRFRQMFCKRPNLITRCAVRNMGKWSSGELASQDWNRRTSRRIPPGLRAVECSLVRLSVSQEMVAAWERRRLRGDLFLCRVRRSTRMQSV